LVQCAVAEIYLYFLVNPLTAGLGLVVIVGYVLLYTPLKTRTSASTAIGAIPGAMPPLMGWTASANEVSIGAWALFLMLFLWQFPHFLAIAWMYREQYAKAGILMLPVVEPEGRITARQIVLFAIMLVPVSLAPFFLGFAGLAYLIGAFVLGIWFLFESVRTARARNTVQARRLLFVSVLYLPLIFGLMVVDHI
jgi:protoheme IX farnesyltransferase